MGELEWTECGESQHLFAELPNFNRYWISESKGGYELTHRKVDKAGYHDTIIGGVLETIPGCKRRATLREKDKL